MISDSGAESVKIRTTCLPNFEVSWAGGSPGEPGCWFGSDDGRVQFMSLDGAELIGPYPIAPSEEAVNGIAFADGLMAVSTRNDVTFLKVPGPRGGHVRRTVFHGRAWCGQHAQRLHHRSAGPAGNPAHGPETGDGPKGENPQARR